MSQYLKRQILKARAAKINLRRQVTKVAASVKHSCRSRKVINRTAVVRLIRNSGTKHKQRQG